MCDYKGLLKDLIFGKNCTSIYLVEESTICPFIILLIRVISLYSLYLISSFSISFRWCLRFPWGSSEVDKGIARSLYRFYSFLSWLILCYKLIEEDSNLRKNSSILRDDHELHIILSESFMQIDLVSFHEGIDSLRWME